VEETSRRMALVRGRAGCEGLRCRKSTTSCSSLRERGLAQGYGATYEWSLRSSNLGQDTQRKGEQPCHSQALGSS